MVVVSDGVVGKEGGGERTQCSFGRFSFGASWVSRTDFERFCVVTRGDTTLDPHGATRGTSERPQIMHSDTPRQTRETSVQPMSRSRLDNMGANVCRCQQRETNP